MLSDALNEESIKLNVECTNWEDAIREAGNVLYKNKIITKEYIENTINGTKELGPYIVIAKGVAMPQATTNIGVLKSGISLITLKEPIEFGNKENDPVYYVFMIATSDMETHISILSNLSDLLQKQEFYNILESANSPSDIIEYIKTNEK